MSNERDLQDNAEGGKNNPISISDDDSDDDDDVDFEIEPVDFELKCILCKKPSVLFVIGFCATCVVNNNDKCKALAVQFLDCLEAV